jgi:O-antigen ligase
MSLSRSAWIGFIASVLTVLFIVEKVKKKIVTPLLWNKKFIWLTLLIPFLFFFFILPRAQRSLYTLTEGGGTFRLEQIGPTLEIIDSHPIFGIGRRMLVLEGLDYAPESIFGRLAFDIHNWYLLEIVEHGILAFIVFMTFLLLSVKLIALDILKKKLNAINDYVRVGILGMVVALSIMGMFQATSGEFYVLTFLGLFNGRNKLNG